MPNLGALVTLFKAVGYGDDDGGGDDDDDEHDDGGDDDQFICQIRQKLNSLTSESLSVPKACEVTVSV